MPNNNKAFITDSPKVNFFIGLVLGVAIISTLGFFGVNFTRDNSAENNAEKVAGEQENQEQPVINLEIAESDYVLGNPDAPVKIFEFSDFQCPYCARHHETLHQIVDEYGDQVAWVFKQFPIASHPLGMPGAVASECAGEQDKFWEMSDKIFSNQETLDLDSFAVFAQELDLDIEQYNTCVADDKYGEKILADYNLGIESGVRGTPSNFINNEMVPGAVPFENLKQMIDELLNK
ncbi:DsbA family protein [Patescibacteria group bacterium]